MAKKFAIGEKIDGLGPLRDRAEDSKDFFAGGGHIIITIDKHTAAVVASRNMISTANFSRAGVARMGSPKINDEIALLCHKVLNTPHARQSFILRDAIHGLDLVLIKPSSLKLALGDDLLKEAAKKFPAAEESTVEPAAVTPAAPAAAAAATTAGPGSKETAQTPAGGAQAGTSKTENNSGAAAKEGPKGPPPANTSKSTLTAAEIEKISSDRTWGKGILSAGTLLISKSEDGRPSPHNLFEFGHTVLAVQNRGDAEPITSYAISPEAWNRCPYKHLKETIITSSAWVQERSKDIPRTPEPGTAYVIGAKEVFFIVVAADKLPPALAEFIQAERAAFVPTKPVPAKIKKSSAASDDQNHDAEKATHGAAGRNSKTKHVWAAGHIPLNAIAATDGKENPLNPEKQIAAGRKILDVHGDQDAQGTAPSIAYIMSLDVWGECPHEGLSEQALSFEDWHEGAFYSDAISALQSNDALIIGDKYVVLPAEPPENILAFIQQKKAELNKPSEPVASGNAIPGAEGTDAATETVLDTGGVTGSTASTADDDQTGADAGEPLDAGGADLSETITADDGAAPHAAASPNADGHVNPTDSVVTLEDAASAEIAAGAGEQHIVPPTDTVAKTDPAAPAEAAASIDEQTVITTNTSATDIDAASAETTLEAVRSEEALTTEVNPQDTGSIMNAQATPLQPSTLSAPATAGDEKIILQSAFAKADTGKIASVVYQGSPRGILKDRARIQEIDELQELARKHNVSTGPNVIIECDEQDLQSPEFLHDTFNYACQSARIMRLRVKSASEDFAVIIGNSAFMSRVESWYTQSDTVERVSARVDL